MSRMLLLLLSIAGTAHASTVTEAGDHLRFFYPAASPNTYLLREGATAVAVSGASLTLTVGDRVVRWSVPGSELAALEPLQRRGGVVHELVGPRARWRRGLPTWGRLEAPAAAAGRLWLRPAPRGLQYGFSFPAGARERFVPLQLEGAEEAHLSDDARAIEWRLGEGAVREEGLSCAQPVAAGVMRAVSCRFTSVQREGNRFRYGIRAEGLDPALPLEIDPYLHVSSYYGGGPFDALNDSALAANGALFVTGTARSAAIPTKDALYTFAGGLSDAILARLLPDGTGLQWATFFGGDGLDDSQAVALTPAGEVVIVGGTQSATLPESTQAPGGADDAFAAKFTQDGQSVVWSVRAAGSGADFARDVAVDPSGAVTVVGHTFSQMGFPATGGFDVTQNGEQDGFVTRLDSSGAVTWSTFLGGPEGETALTVAVDGLGDVFVGGFTSSPSLATSGTFQTAFSMTEDVDGFVARITNAGGLGWFSYLGGVGEDQVLALVLAPNGQIVVGGSSASDLSPTAGAADTAALAVEGFVARITADGKTRLWLTYLGGDFVDEVRALAFDEMGDVIAAGFTNSLNFPGLVPPFDEAEGGDGFLARLSSDGKTIDSASVFGGTGNDAVESIEFVAPESIWLVGNTNSTTFPLVQPFDSTIQTSSGFVAWVREDDSPPLSGVVNDGAGADIDEQPADQTLRANWSGFEDPQSGVSHYLVAIGTAPLLDDVLALGDVGDVTSIEESVPLTPGTTYFVTVTVVNRAGATNSASSDGVLITEAAEGGTDAGTPMGDGGTTDGGLEPIPDAGTPADAGHEPPVSLIGWSCGATGSTPALLALLCVGFAVATRRRIV